MRARYRAPRASSVRCLAEGHSLRGRAKRRAAAGLHLDKDDVALVLADEIDLAAAEAHVANQHTIAPRRQRFDRGVLAGPASRAPQGPRSDD